MRRRVTIPTWAQLALALAAAGGVLAWASSTPTEPEPARGESVRVCAAASLTAAMADLAELVHRRTGHRLLIDVAGSGTLARQIEAGAPAAIYISANTRWMDHLVDLGRVNPDGVTTLLTNRLVLVTPKDRPLELPPTPDAALPLGRVAIGDPAHVPAGMYAEQALRTLGWYETLAGRLLPCASVSAALALAEAGEVDAAIVYASDAAGSDRVAVATVFPSDTHQPIEYPAAPIGQPTPAAVAVLAELHSAAAAEVFRRHGFSPRQAEGAPAPPPALAGGAADPAQWLGPMKRSIRVALLATLCLLPGGVGLSWLLARKRFPGKSLVSAGVHLPLVIPPVATGYLLLLALGRNAPLGRWLSETFSLELAFAPAGAVLASMVVALPLMVRSIRLSLESVDPQLEQAARTMGSGRWRTFWTVTLPLAGPGVLAGCVLSFARSLGEFGATITFAGNLAGQTRTLPLASYAMMQTPGRQGAAMTLVGVSVVLSVGAILAVELLARRLRARKAVWA